MMRPILMALAMSVAVAGCHKKKPQNDWYDPPTRSRNQNEVYQDSYARQHPDFYSRPPAQDNGASWLPWMMLMNQSHNNSQPSVVYRDRPVAAPSPSYSVPSASPSPSAPSGYKSYSSQGSAYSAPKAAPSHSYSSSGKSYSAPSRSYSAPSRSYSSPSRSYSSGGSSRSYSRGR